MERYIADLDTECSDYDKHDNNLYTRDNEFHYNDPVFHFNLNDRDLDHCQHLSEYYDSPDKHFNDNLDKQYVPVVFDKWYDLVHDYFDGLYRFYYEHDTGNCD